MLEYSVNSVEIQSAGTGYSVNDQLTIDLDTDDAKLKVVQVSAGTATANAITNRSLAVTGYFDPVTDQFVPSDDPQYAMSGYEVGQEFTLDVSVISESVTTAPVLKVTSVDGGAITGLEVKTPGSFTLAEEYGDTLGTWFTSSEYTYSGVGTNAILQVYFSRVYEGGGEIQEVAIVDAGESTTSTVENPVSATGGTGSGAKFNIVLGAVFEEVEVTDVPGTMPKPATEVSYVSYEVSYPALPIDYNTTFTREYPVQG